MKVVFTSLVPLVLLLRGNDARPVKTNESPQNTRLRGAGIIPTTVTRRLSFDLKKGGRGKGLLKKEKSGKSDKKSKSGKSDKKSKSGKGDELSKKEKSGKSGKSAKVSADEARNPQMVWGGGNETMIEVDDALEISLLEEDAEYADDDDDATEPTDPPTSVGTSAGTSEESSEESSEATSEETFEETNDETEEASEEPTSEESSEESSEETSEETSNDEPTRKSYVD